MYKTGSYFLTDVIHFHIVSAEVCLIVQKVFHMNAVLGFTAANSDHRFSSHLLSCQTKSNRKPPRQVFPDGLLYLYIIKGGLLNFEYTDIITFFYSNVKIFDHLNINFRQFKCNILINYCIKCNAYILVRLSAKITIINE